MKITFTVIGKNNEQFINDACKMYLQRIEKFYKIGIKVIQLKEKQKKADVIKTNESKLILNAFKNADCNILLDENGKTFTSINFANFMQQQFNLSYKHIQFFVGGAYGFSEEVYKNAKHKISLSDMTFSHQIIRIMFLEQLYRAISIIHHLPYHNE